MSKGREQKATKVTKENKLSASTIEGTELTAQRKGNPSGPTPNFFTADCTDYTDGTREITKATKGIFAVARAHERKG